MDSSRARAIILASWAGFAGLVTVQHIVNPQQRGLPPPRLFLASGVLFSLFYLSAGILGTLPAVLAVGVDVAVLVNPYLKGASDASLIQQLAGTIDTIAGKSPGPAVGSPGGRMATA